MLSSQAIRGRALRGREVIVAIDGPAGVGKSTVARLLAGRLGFSYLDTGAMYRAVTWLALERDVPLEDEAELAALASANPVSFDDGRVAIAGRDVTGEIRETRVDGAVSAVSRHGVIREIMRARQRELAHAGDSVLEGRDIGSVVCPDAEVKVWLVADPVERARRRGAERPETSPDETLTGLRLRDELDAGQMQRAPDAQIVDSTRLDVDDVVAVIARMVEEARLA